MTKDLGISYDDPPVVEVVAATSFGRLPDRGEGSRSHIFRLPDWIADTVSDLNSLLQLGENWDGYQSRTVSADAAQELLNLIVDASEHAPFPPWISSTSEGGVMAEWRTGQQLLQLEVTPDLEPTVFYQSEPFARYWEGPLGGSHETRTRRSRPCSE